MVWRRTITKISTFIGWDSARLGIWTNLSTEYVRGQFIFLCWKVDRHKIQAVLAKPYFKETYNCSNLCQYSFLLMFWLNCTSVWFNVFWRKFKYMISSLQITLWLAFGLLANTLRFVNMQWQLCTSLYNFIINTNEH